MNQWSHSIRWRIFAYYTALIAAAIVLLAAMNYAATMRTEQRLAGSRLQARLMEMMPFLIPPREAFGRPPTEAEMSRQRERPRFQAMIAKALEDGVFVMLVGRNGAAIYQSPNLPKDFQIPPAGRPGERFSNFVQDRLLVAQLRAPSGPRVFVGMPVARAHEQAGNALRNTVVVGFLAFAVISLLGNIIIRTGLQPIEKIGAAARRIADGDLAGRIDVTAQRSELGRLAEVLNDTFARLQEALQRQVRFTADASHELRTPVAAILADCQFALKKPRPPERYRETIEVCHESAQHMRSLIERLGVLAKFDALDAPVEREPVDLAALATSVGGVVAPLADERGIALETELAPAEVSADRLRLGQAVINLLNNAIRYNRPQGRVWLRTGVTDGRAFVEVEDTGVGIPVDQLDRVFERFFRVDESRNGKTGGSGLGLAICKSIMEAHDGTVTAESEVGKGSRFRIELPVAG